MKDVIFSAGFVLGGLILVVTALLNKRLTAPVCGTFCTPPVEKAGRIVKFLFGLVLIGIGAAPFLAGG